MSRSEGVDVMLGAGGDVGGGVCTVSVTLGADGGGVCRLIDDVFNVDETVITPVAVARGVGETACTDIVDARLIVTVTVSVSRAMAAR